MTWNSTAELAVLSNDVDPDGDQLEINSVDANFGTAEVSSQQTILYTPPQGYAGSEVLVYTVTDGNGGVASALVTININGNRAPGAVDDAAQTDDVTSIEIAVLANDLDVDGDALNLQSAEAEFGSVTIMDGSSLNVPDTILYTPQTGFDGLDTITYVVADTSGATASAVVSVVVDGNQAPEATDDSVNTGFETAIKVDVLANDMDINGDELIVIEASTNNGNVVINADNTLTFTPASGFTGPAQVQYTVSDGALSASALLTVNVAAAPTTLPTDNNANSSGGAIGFIGLILLTMLGWRRRRVV